jgi:predicted dinucleotide-binding enzyme
MTTLGIIGAGNIGSNVAKAAIAAGYEVVISNSRGPETLTDLIEELGPKARAATAADAAAAGDFALVAVPLGKYQSVPVEGLEGKVVLDANNYYPQRDGHIAALDTNESTTSELLQAHLPNSYVVKAFNNIAARDIPKDGLPAGNPNRRALPIAGNDTAARQDAAAFLNAIGFDAVDLGTLRDTTADVTRVQQV